MILIDRIKVHDGSGDSCFTASFDVTQVLTTLRCSSTAALKNSVS